MSKKLVAFNSSWALDCHRSQVDINGFISEAAAIVKKFKTINPNGSHFDTNLEINYIDKDMIPNYEDYHKKFNEANKIYNANLKGKSDEDKKKLENEFNATIKGYQNEIQGWSPASYELFKIQQFNNKGKHDNIVDTFRRELGDKCSEYYAQKLKDDVDFIAMIEQVIHVPAGHVANHDMGKNGEFMKAAPLDLTNASYINKIYYDQDDLKNENYGISKNENYGILKRIGIMEESGKSILDMDKSMDTFKTDKSDYVICYDNCVNTSISTGAGEGIAIVYKKNLVDEPLVWNYNKLPLNAANMPEKNIEVGFYVDDLGPVFCNDADKKPIYIKGNGQLDYGRPIMMTGGIKDNKLNLFVALHGPNFLNLKKVGTDIFFKDPSVDKTEKNAMYLKLTKALEDFINAGLKSVKSTSDITNINLYLGGDANDAEGVFMENLQTNGISVTYNENKMSITIINNKLKPGNKIGKYDLYTCCANKDSIHEGRDTRPTPGTLGGIDKNRENDIKNYPDNFIDPANYGYNGDFAFFGSYNYLDLQSTSNLTIDHINMHIQENNQIKIKDNNTITYLKNIYNGEADLYKENKNIKDIENNLLDSLPGDIYDAITEYTKNKSEAALTKIKEYVFWNFMGSPSDHLPVICVVEPKKGGRRRTRRRVRNMKRKQTRAKRSRSRK